MVTKITIPDIRLDWANDIFNNNSQYFRHNEPRLYQDTVIGLVLDSIKHGYTNVILQLPTGSGKSDVGMTIAKKFEDDGYYLLSMNLGLLRQYLDDFQESHNIKELKGRGNFPCPMRHGYTADHGFCVYKKKYDCDKFHQCPYQRQKTIAQNSDGVLSTPAYMCRVTRNSFPQRFITIWDEAHRLEKFFIDMLESQIYEDEYTNLFQEPLPQYTSGEFWKNTLKKISEECDKRLEKEEFLKDKEIEKLKNILHRSNLGIRLLANKENRYLISFDKTRIGKAIVRFRTVKVNGIANKIISDIGEINIFMSATIGNINQFIYNLGLNSDKTFFINLKESIFPKENRPIVYESVGYLSFNKREETMPKICSKITQLIEKHDNQRGVILPVSHNFSKQIYNYLYESGFSDRILWHDSDKSNREEAIGTFLSEVHNPLVLISTYVSEGFDFYGKLAEFLIFVKVPYPNIMDELINKRMVLEQESYRDSTGCNYIEPESGKLCNNYSCGKPCQTWYYMQTANAICQGAGRIVRTPEDKGIIYILDKGFKSFYNRWSFLFPKYFRESIIWKT